ncbi:RHS repeat-associated core domain-containing protein [Pseudomonas laurylsulfatiphila]|uniref:Type IV secretion protein Rhs n=1 Tax=Pseudomonas laurylsulfatiphila TaxID=2011015 RepID=A0A2S6FLX9_9PSED|nr:RHS repeat-associated core domain-containing protein [Pseudomonas laurylsulfatiphila]PPK38431.1 type IV secretion protein Rhs [Pseudomonas laurylsulfatiphila]
MTHANTPAIQVFDPRGLSVRGVAYHRRQNASVAQPCITQQEYDGAGRAVLSRDPRLFRLHQDGQPTANQQYLFSLSGAVVLSHNSDAGWRLGLLGAHGQWVEGWDQKLSQNRVDYDPLCRPVATFERAWQGAERCIARFTYADNDADACHNLRGHLIRQDDTAGTLLFTGFSLNGTPLQHSRTFIADPQWPVDWPESVPERDALLEIEPAITRLHCNAASEAVSQTDALGNRQTFIHNCAGELREVRLKLAGQADETALVQDIQYNAFGHVEQQRAGNGVISRATFRPDDGRLEQLKAYVTGQPALQDLTYEYDAVGNVTCITDAAQATHFHRNQRIEPVNRYRYDSLYRLIEASGRQLRNAPGGPQLPDFQATIDPGQLENYTRLYTYDEAGNLKVMQHQADSACRTERTAVARFSNRSLPEKTNDELPDEQEIAAGHDLNGNRTELQPGQSLQWNLCNQLRQVDQVVREEEPDDCEFYVYDGGGQRQRKIRQAYTGKLIRTHETRYLPGLEIRTSADEILHVITVKAGRGTVQVLHWQKGQPTGIPQDQQRYSFTDHLGSSTLELDEAALLISRESYYPYGGTCWWAGRNKVEASYKTLRYSGQERDASGLYYYGFRYYLPWCQRWLSADPAGTVDGLNLYSMVNGNPIGHVDLQGLSLFSVVRGAAMRLWESTRSFFSGNIPQAMASAAARDYLGSHLGNTVAAGVNLAFDMIRATPGRNTALRYVVESISFISVYYSSAGVSGNHLQSANSLAVGTLPALSVSAGYDIHAQHGQDEWDPVTRARFVGQTSAISRGLFQQLFRGFGSNFEWGDVPLRERLSRTVAATVLYSAGTTSRELGRSHVPEVLQPNLSPTIEALDGAVGTLLRSTHPHAAHQPHTATVQMPNINDLSAEILSRTTNAEWSYWGTEGVEWLAEAITGNPADSQSASTRRTVAMGRAVVSAVTELRGYVNQYVRRGWSRILDRSTVTASASSNTFV